MSVNEQKLREKLDQILDFMAENKLISKEACEKMKTEKEGGFLDTLVKDLSNSGMEDADIRNEHFQKKLMGTLVTHSLGMHEATKAGMTALTDALTLKDKDSVPLEKSLGDPEKNIALDKLQAQSVILSNALNKDSVRNDSLTPSPKPDFNAAAKEMMADFNKAMEKKLENNEQEKKEFQELSKEMERELSETLRNAFDGVDPRFTGGVQGTFDEPIKAFMDCWIEPAADPNSLSARVQEATENLPGNDPQGIKDKNKSILDTAADILSPIVECVTSEFNHQDKLTPRLNHHN